MQRTTPPFRADHVGSLLRPAAAEGGARQARAQRDHSRRAARGRRSRDREGDQEAGGDRAETRHRRRVPPLVVAFRFLPGSRRRHASTRRTHGIQFSRRADQGRSASRSTARSASPAIRCWSISSFSKAHARVVPKMTIPAPSTFAFPPGPRRDQQGGLSRRSIRFSTTLPRPIAARSAPSTTPAAAICSSTTPPGRWCAIRTSARNRKTRGDDPDALPQRYARLTNAALEGKPADMAITMHSCRGNFRSTFIASGGYEFVAEQLLGNTGLDGYFLEYDSDRAGGFEPLRFFPKGNKQLVLGLVTSKSGALEKQGRHQAPHRRGDQIRRARSALPVAAMRLCLDRGRQRAVRGRAMGEAADDRGNRRRSVGLSMQAHQAAVPRRPCRQPAAHASLKEAREKRARGEIAADALKAIEDREIEGVIRKQEAVGLQIDHRRRIPAHLVELRFPRAARQRQILCRRAQDQIRSAAARSRGRSCCASSASSAATSRIR